MQQLLRICAEEGIEVFYRPIDPVRRGALGFYFRTPISNPVIALDDSLPTRPRLERCILAEEIGHFYHVPRSNVFSLHFATKGADVEICRDEARAVRWAANHLIPTQEMADAIKRGVSTVDELADEFFVTPWMAWRKLAVIRQDLRQHHRLRVKFRDLFSPLLVDVKWGLE